MKNRHRTFYAMIIHGDFETRSEVDLKEVGLDVYARHPSTDVWCFGWAREDESPHIWFPTQHYDDLWEGGLEGITIVAHNAPFELAIWNHICVPRYGWPPLRPEQTRCTMAMAYAMALPGSLENASAALGLTQQKDMAGHRLMMQMSRPRAIEPDGTVVWWDDFDKQMQLAEYCKQDVRTEQALCKRLLQLSESEQKIWELDYKINQRGIYIDRTAVTTAMWVVKKEVERLNGEMQKATNGEVCAATEVATMTKWIQSRGVPIEGLAKADVIDALKLDYVPEDVRKALLIRQEAGKTSTAKLHTMVTCLNDDHRARGLLQYHAAGTGRWGGRRIQVQNLPRPSIPHETIEQVIDVLTRASIDEAHEMITTCFDRPMTVISDCLRGMICAAPGHELMAADFANIEGRVLAWLAGEQWKLDAFSAYDRKEGEDIYKLTASRIYSVPSKEVNKDQRQIGKVAELACIAENTLVLTNTGGKPIQDLTTEDQVWDGLNWVKHRGVVNKGQRPVINLAGIELTPDHLILTGKIWKPAQQLASNRSFLESALEKGSENLPSLDTFSDQRGVVEKSYGPNVPAERQNTESTLLTYEKGEALVAMRVRKNNPATGVNSSGGTLILSPVMSTEDACLIESLRVLTDATIQRIGVTPIMEAGAFVSRPSGARIAALFSVISSHCQDGIRPLLSLIAKKWTKDTSQGTFSSSPAQKTRVTVERSRLCNDISSNLKPVYDLAHAGPLNRFTIITEQGPLLVHNCGYQGGVGAFQTMAKTYRVEVKDELAEQIKTAWREAHPSIVAYWYALERAAKDAVMNPGQKFACGPKGREVTYLVKGSFLFCKLPSGRALCYPYPKLKPKETPWGEMREQIHYMKVDGMSKKWQEANFYGGLGSENVTQAVSRDILADAMLRVESYGLEIVMHVHDEIVIELSPHNPTKLETFEKIVARVPDWASGLPIAVEGWRGLRYRK